MSCQCCHCRMQPEIDGPDKDESRLKTKNILIQQKLLSRMRTLKDGTERSSNSHSPDG